MAKSGKCKICGAELSYRDGQWVCPFCGAAPEETIRCSTDEELEDLKVAKNLLRTERFAEAQEQFEDFVARYPKNSEGYWGKLLSTYHIRYVRDADGKDIPSSYAPSIDSFLNDPDYQKAISLANANNKARYKRDAEYMENVRKKWISEAKKEKPYDIFICFKDTIIEQGVKRTKDSFEMEKLYDMLIKDGYRVFFSRVSLRDKVGEEKYEPFIYYAIETAKIMLVYGSNKNYFEAGWIKNEWSRYLMRIDRGEKKKNSLVLMYDAKKVDPSKLTNKLRNRQGYALEKKIEEAYPDIKKIIEKILGNYKEGPIIKRITIDAITRKRTKSEDTAMDTVELGASKVSRRKSKLAKIETRQLGSYQFPVLAQKAEQKLKIADKDLANGNFKEAKAVYLELIEAHGDNPNVLFSLMCAENKCKNEEEFTNRLDKFTDYELLDRTLNCADPKFGSKLLGIFATQILFLIGNDKVKQGLDIYNHIRVYQDKKISTLNTKMVDLVLDKYKAKEGSARDKYANQVSNVVSSVLEVVADNVDAYCNILSSVLQAFLYCGEYRASSNYLDLLKEVDPNGYYANLYSLMYEVRSTSFEDLIDKTINNNAASSFDEVIKGMSKSDATSFVSKAVELIKEKSKRYISQLDDKKFQSFTELIAVLIHYKFEERKDFIENLLDDIISLDSTECNIDNLCTLFDLLVAEESKNTKKYETYTTKFANLCSEFGKFECAETYFALISNDVNEASSSAAKGRIASAVGCSSFDKEDDMSSSIGKLEDVSLVENLLRCYKDEEDQMEVISKIARYCVNYVNRVSITPMNVSNEDVENCVLSNQYKVFNLFNTIIKYVPESDNDFLVDRLVDMANACKENKHFVLAEYYYASIISIDKKDCYSYWGLLQAKLHCAKETDLIRCNKPISNYPEFNNAITIASEVNDQALESFMNIRDAQKSRLRTLKVLKIGGIIVAGAIALGIGISTFVKSQSKLIYHKLSDNTYEVKAGMFYNEEIVIIPEDHEGSKVTALSSKAFMNNNSIYSITLPNSLTSIGTYAFKNSSVSRITVPSSVIEIKKEAFNNCQSLDTLVFDTREEVDISFDDNWDKGVENIEWRVKINYHYTDSKIESTYVVYNSNSRALIPTRDGYVFNSWNDKNGNLIVSVAGTKVSPWDQKTTYDLYASWIANTNSISYIPNGGTGTMTGFSAKTDEVVKLTANKFTKSGYTFTGWKDSSNGKIYSDKAEYVVGTDLNITLTAQWSANQNVLNFNANGGQGKLDSLKVETDNTIKLPTPSFTREGYIFEGWATSSSGALTYENNAYYKMGTNSSYTLYAKWVSGTPGLTLTLSTNQDYYSVTGYTGTKKSINIPTSFVNKPVTTITASAFEGKGITSISIPNSITSIGDNAFKNNGLTDVTIPTSVTYLGSSILINNNVEYLSIPFFGSTISAEGNLARFFGGYVPSSLKSLSITNAKTLQKDNLSYYDGLTSITLSSSFTYISSNSLSSCTGLKSLTIPFVGNSSTDSLQLSYLFSSTSGVPSTLKTLTVLNGEIEKDAFNGASITSLTIENASEIANGALNGLNKLEYLSIPYLGLTSATSSNKYLSRLFSSSTTSSNNPSVIPSTLKTVRVTGGSVIAIDAFKGCTNLTDIYLPSNLTMIGASAFAGCTGIRSISLPSTLTSIDDNAFANCNALTTINFGGDETAWNAIIKGSGNDKLTTVTIRYNTK